MDFGLTREQEEFRQEVRAFLDAELPADWVGYPAPTTGDHTGSRQDGERVFKDISRKLGEKGWLSLFWPKEYGGQSRSYIDYLIFSEEIARRGSPGYNPVSVKMLAPTLIEYGTEEQKARHLGPIAKGEELWCEGFSEPEAGSDLASLQTRAVRDGRSFIVNGQKTWSTFAEYSDWCCLLARSDPNSRGARGLSFLLVDLSTPGITLSPIENMARELHFSQIFFEEVRVPETNLVGREGEGWEVAQALLGYERTSIEFVAMVQTMIEKLVKYIRATPERQTMNNNDRLARLVIDAEIGRLLNYRVAWLHDKGINTAWHAAMTKLYSTDLFRRASGVAIQLLGLYGQLDKEEALAPWQGWIEHSYLVSFGATIAAGTSEIQKNIIALKGLELPRR